MKIGVIGSGDVARTLAGGFLGHGYEVLIGTRNPAKLKDWTERNPRARVGTFAEAANFAEVIVLAVKGTASAEALRSAGATNLAGKPVIDATNPIADSPRHNGVLKFFTTLDESLMERLQHEFPAAHFVKAFNSVGNACMVNPSFVGGKPTMFICGNDEAAKRTVEAGQVRLGHGGHGPSRGSPRDRTAVHAVVHPRIRAQRLDARVQVAQVDWAHSPLRPWYRNDVRRTCRTCRTSGRRHSGVV